MTDILADSSYALAVASKPVAGIAEIELKIGKIRLIVLSDVLDELNRMKSRGAGKKAKAAQAALEFLSSLPAINSPDSGSVDEKLLDYAKRHNVAVATVDRNLRKRLRKLGIPVLTLSRRRLMWEGPLR